MSKRVRFKIESMIKDKNIQTEWRQGEYTISTDRRRVDLEFVHDFLRASYWAENIPFKIVRHSIENSLCFGLYEAEKQIGFARVVTDCATFAYLCDVFVVEEFRGRGLSKWLMEIISAHPELQNLRRWLLATKDAHGLYNQFGFTALDAPSIFMQRHTSNIYL